MLNQNLYIRQTGLINPEKLAMPIAVIGAGGIGSWTTLALLKMGCQDVKTFDFDSIEEHNAGSQIYTDLDSGRPKVEILHNKLYHLVDNLDFFSPIQGKVEKETLSWLLDRQIVVFGVDNIEARKEIYEGIKGTAKFLIDGRMGGNTIQIYTVRLNNEEDCKFYEETVFPTEETLEVPCSERAVVYNCFVMAGLITDIVAQKANGDDTPRELIVDLLNFTIFK
jgi:molybdopterin/thiamine biosynthesis adenylyltransferase